MTALANLKNKILVMEQELEDAKNIVSKLAGDMVQLVASEEIILPFSIDLMKKKYGDNNVENRETTGWRADKLYDMEK